MQVLPLAFGSARLPSGADAGVAEARAALLDWPTGERISVVWPEPIPRAALPREGGKIMLLLGLTALDCLGGSGNLAIHAQSAANGLLWTAVGTGARATLAADMAAALAGQSAIEDLTPKTAPAAYAALLAAGIHMRLAYAAAPGEIKLECVIPLLCVAT